MVLFGRLITTTVAAGGLLAVSVLLGAGIASAAPAPSSTVPASCGQTVVANDGDTVVVTPRVGLPERYTVTGQPGTVQRIPSSLARPSCEVDIRIPAAAVAAAPVAAAPPAAAPAAAPAVVPVAPAAAAPVAPARPVAPLPRIAAPKAAAPRVSHGAAAGGDLLSAPAPSGLGSIAPGALPGAPAAVPAPALTDPSARVVNAGNDTRLAPADTSSGLGVPVLVALVAGAGVAAVGVRMLVVRRAAASAPTAGAPPAGATSTGMGPDPQDEDEQTQLVDRVAL